MRDGNRDLTGHEPEHNTLQPGRSEFAELLEQSDALAGFNIEWVFDRFGWREEQR